MRYLNKRNEFIDTKKYSLIKENESGSGPFANDLGWHDSLLGRLIDHSIRKAKIKYKANRMDKLIKQLKDEFDRINSEGAATRLDEEDWKNLTRLKLYSIFYNLTEAVEKGYKVRIIKNLTNEALETVEGMKEVDEYEKLKSELEEFKKFLEQFDDNVGSDDPTLSGEKESGEKSKEGELSSGKVYALMIKNLTSLSHILSNYEKVNLGKSSISRDTESSKRRTYTTKEGDTFKKIQSNPEVNIKKLDIASIRQKNSNVSKAYADDNQTMKPGLVLVMESISLLENKFGTGGSKDRANIKSGEDHLTQAFIKLKKDIEVLKSSKEKGIGIDVNFLSEIVKGKNDSTNKEYIKSLYRDIKRYLVGDAKNTIQEKDPLYKESIEIISDKRKRMVVAEKIARFSKRAMQFKGTGLEGGLGDLKKPLQDFISSMEIILKSDISDKEPKKEEVKESKLFRYNKFVAYIKEAEESEASAEERQAGDIKESNISTKIKEFFDKNCMTVKGYVMEKTEAEKLGKNLEAKEKEGKEDGFVISGFDPIIEICRLFNRAFKLYIVRNQREITKRSDSKYSSAFIEYTELGSNGPWRNNKLFDQWENAVFDILGDSKYQHIFSPSTKLRIPKVPNPSKPEDYELRDKAGSNLRKMITDLLDGDDLYKIGSGKEGKQNEFLEKYFGEPDDKAKKQVEKEGLAYGDDADVNEDSSKNIKTVELSFSKPKSVKLEKGTFFVIKGTKDKDGKPQISQKSFFIVDSNDPKYLYVMLSGSFRKFNSYLDKSIKGKKKIENNFPRKGESEMFYSRIEKDTIKNGLVGKIKIVSIKKGSKNKKEETITVNDVFYLCSKSPEGRGEVVYNIPSENLNDIIKHYKDEPDIKGLISAAPSSDDIKITKLK